MPRFYFLGDDDLLEILGQAQNPTVIQSHLKKLFQGINSVQFSPDGKQIVSGGDSGMIKVWDSGAFWASNRLSLASPCLS